jgi:hypothetical protein
MWKIGSMQNGRFLSANHECVWNCSIALPRWTMKDGRMDDMT